MDPEYEAIQRARMSQMQQGQGDEQKRQQMEDMTNSMLGQLLDQSARARLNNLALVNATKAKQVEGMLMQMARQGQVKFEFFFRIFFRLSETYNFSTQDLWANFAHISAY